MTHRRRFPLPLVLTCVFLGGVALPVAQADPPKPCIKAKQKTSQVQAACDRGGLDEAKKYMKGLVDKAKAAGNAIKCQSCHENLKTYELTPNGQADLEKLL